MKQYQSKHTAALSTRGFYTILSLCALIIAASAWVIWGNAHRQNAVEPDTGMPIIAPADSTAEAPTEPATVPQQEQEPESVIEEQPVAAAEPEPAVTVSAPVYVRPVSGAVLTPFSGDTLLFQPTMGDWRVHAGTDFSAEAGETVLALTDGTVQQIAEVASATDSARYTPFTPRKFGRIRARGISSITLRKRAMNSEILA